MQSGSLGKVYKDREVIVRQGEAGDCMFIVQSGRVEVLMEDAGKETILSVMGNGDIFGEMSLFDRSPRSATVRAQNEARVLTIDKRTFLRRVHEDPSLAFRILEKMSRRIRTLNEELAQSKKTGLK